MWARIGRAARIHSMRNSIGLAARWPRWPSAEKRQRLQGLIARIALKPEGQEIGVRPILLADILRRGEEIGAREPRAVPDEPVLVLTIAAGPRTVPLERPKEIFGVSGGTHTGIGRLTGPRGRSTSALPPRNES